MRLQRFDLNLLIALDALLREKSVTRAAERVFVSQPAMSTALNKLREYLNDPLLVRVGQTFELTPKGLALIEPTHEALQHVLAALGTQAVFDPATSHRTFRAMIPDFVVPWLLPPVIQRFNQAGSGVRLELENWSSTGPARVVHGELDFFVAIDSARLLGLDHFPDSLASIELRPVRWICAASKDNPLIEADLTREQFLQLPHVYVRTPGDGMPTVEAVRRQLGMELDVRISTQNVLEVPFILPGTPLVAIMPESLALQLSQCLSLKLFNLPSGLLPRRQIRLFWHRRSEPDPGHGWLRNLIQEVGAAAA
jgi:LysR family nod box-dependent transcriptional activator